MVPTATGAGRRDATQGVSRACWRILVAHLAFLLHAAECVTPYPPGLTPPGELQLPTRQYETQPDAIGGAEAFGAMLSNNALPGYTFSTEDMRAGRSLDPLRMFGPPEGIIGGAPRRHRRLRGLANRSSSATETEQQARVGPTTTDDGEDRPKAPSASPEGLEPEGAVLEWVAGSSPDSTPWNRAVLVQDEYPALPDSCGPSPAPPGHSLPELYNNAIALMFLLRRNWARSACPEDVEDGGTSTRAAGCGPEEAFSVGAGNFLGYPLFREQHIPLGEQDEEHPQRATSERVARRHKAHAYAEFFSAPGFEVLLRPDAMDLRMAEFVVAASFGSGVNTGWWEQLKLSSPSETEKIAMAYFGSTTSGRGRTDAAKVAAFREPLVITGTKMMQEMCRDISCSRDGLGASPSVAGTDEGSGGSFSAERLLRFSAEERWVQFADPYAFYTWLQRELDGYASAAVQQSPQTRRDEQGTEGASCSGAGFLPCAVHPVVVAACGSNGLSVRGYATPHCLSKTAVLFLDAVRAAAVRLRRELDRGQYEKFLQLLEGRTAPERQTSPLSAEVQRRRRELQKAAAERICRVLQLVFKQELVRKTLAALGNAESDFYSFRVLQRDGKVPAGIRFLFALPFHPGSGGGVLERSHRVFPHRGKAAVLTEVADPDKIEWDTCWSWLFVDETLRTSDYENFFQEDGASGGGVEVEREMRLKGELTPTSTSSFGQASEETPAFTAFKGSMEHDGELPSSSREAYTPPPARGLEIVLQRFSV